MLKRAWVKIGAEMTGPAGEQGGGVGPRVEIFTWRWCPYCLRAKALLDSLGVPYREICIDGDPEARRRMAERAGGRWTVPQVFIDGRPVGGYTELAALHRDGGLRPLLEARPPGGAEGGEGGGER